ncbi:hypothetical protein KY386_00320 [Candidatus Parcubacteria bacterium]|nr:hypothetical protein [Candidatus Parcubacteria bacterium]
MGRNVRKLSYLLAVVFGAGVVLPPAASLASGPGKPPAPKPPGINLPREIAHAAGGIDGQIYTNSLEALEHNYDKGYRWLEVDLHLTSDGAIVLLHDWENAFVNLFGAPPGVRSLTEFKTLPAVNNYTQLTIEGLAAWAHSHPDSYLLLDTKIDHIGMLSTIRARYPALVPRFIPYVASPEHYRAAKALGYQEVFWLIGETVPTDQELLSLAARYRAPAVAMPPVRAAGGLPRQLRAGGTKSYSWGINDETTRLALQQNYVAGVLTDFLEVLQPAPSAGTVKPGIPDRLSIRTDSRSLWHTPYNKFGDSDTG